MHFLNPLGDGDSEPGKSLSLEVDGFGGPQNNFSHILRTQTRLCGVRGKWFREICTEES